MRTRFSKGYYHEPGIYFGMPFDEYISDWALGSSDLINLEISPSTYYWNSNANPLRTERETPSLRYGRAIHKAVLEGEEAFKAEYAMKAPPPEPGMLVSLEDLRAKCEELGLPKSGNKAALIRRIREAGDTTPIYQEIVDKYEKEAGNRIMLDPDIYSEVLMASKVIRMNPHLTNAFRSGYPEVSVFFEHLGVPMRARFDYLKPRAVVDLKSIRNHLRMPWPVAVANAIARHNYPVQAALYLAARAAAAKFIAEGRVYGEVPPDQWLEAVAKEQNFCFVWVFYQAEGAPITKGVIFDEKCEEFLVANQKIINAVELYKKYISEFDTDLWIEASEIDHFSSLSMPMWWGQ